jgi:pyridoxamine 5'-phosphate oxidase
MKKKKNILSEKSVSPDPFLQFDTWYKEHLSANIPIPDTMSLGTSGSDGTVSVRTVLLKDYSEIGFVFFSNYLSKKGMQLGSNPRAALLFYWPETARQIRIEGDVLKISGKESDLYFDTRPEDSRISAWASEQSSAITDRAYLENRFSFYKNKFSGNKIDRPPHWGGYILKPSWFEFWQEGEFRLHDRVSYSLTGEKWIIRRLAP